MKKVILAFFCFSTAIMACNSGNSASKSSDSASTTTTAKPEAPAASEKGLELIGASDCTTCHRLHKESAGASIGPAYSDVAAKYTATAADTTVNRIVHKIMNGGSGIWGTVPMTPHPALSEADVKEMVTYILSLKK